MLTVESKDDDPAKIITRGKIRELLAKYKKEMDEFEEYVDQENQKVADEAYSQYVEDKKQLTLPLEDNA
ncbi:MAG: hypothetical protein H8E55_71280 [Pelagibacterales bacterium]|nr:hypothetical protein [Pelagibacterales bacterium]